jgi:hypothetical protein
MIEALHVLRMDAKVAGNNEVMTEEAEWDLMNEARRKRHVTCNLPNLRSSTNSARQ